VRARCARADLSRRDALQLENALSSHDSSFPLLVERFSFLSAFPRRVRGPKNCLFPKKGGAD
jgi:hypothetical protein